MIENLKKRHLKFKLNLPEFWMFEFIGESLWFCLFVPPKFRGRLVETPEPDVVGGSEDARFILHHSFSHNDENSKNIAL